MICPPPFAKPIIQFVQRIKASIAANPLCGVWYRRWVKRLEVILCLIGCSSETYGDEVEVNEDLTLVRIADQMAVKAVIVNIGSEAARIYEDGLLVQVLWPGRTWESPAAGQLNIEAEAVASTTTLTVTTYKRCDCGINDPDYYAVNEPIGGNLL